MISGINLTETVDFILPNDTDNPTVWKIGMIPSGVLAQIGGSAKDNPVEIALKMLQIGLKGWVNFNGVDFATEKKDIGGQSIDVVPMSLINRIPLNVVMAISEVLVKINSLSDIERKN